MNGDPTTCGRQYTDLHFDFIFRHCIVIFFLFFCTTDFQIFIIVGSTSVCFSLKSSPTAKQPFFEFTFVSDICQLNTDKGNFPLRMHQGDDSNYYKLSYQRVLVYLFRNGMYYDLFKY